MENHESLREKPEGDPREVRGSFTLGTGAAIPFRAFVPSAHTAETPCPLVLALHGVKEKEDFFFWACGWNLLSRLAEEHGFLILSPRISRTLVDALRLGTRGFAPRLKEEAGKRFRTAEDRFFLLGHSMGGFEAWREASSDSLRVTALACLGGSPPLFRPHRVRDIPIYLGVGTEDPMLPLTRTTAWLARRSGLPRFRYREVKGLGHVQVVRELMPEVFEWFSTQAMSNKQDSILKKKRPEQGSNL